MLSLLIADDEMVIRQSLVEYINWESIGVEVVACCANGLEALDDCIDHSPNIVLTDIKMPGMNGLELIEQLQLMNYDTEFIVLSGFREFDFARKAIDLGVSSYVLKPISEEQVLATVAEAARKSELKKSVRDSLADAIQLQKQLRRYCLQQLQSSMFLHEDTFTQAVNAYLERFSKQNESYLYLAIQSVSLSEAQAIVLKLLPYINQSENNLITDFFYGQNLLTALIRRQPGHDIEIIRKMIHCITKTAAVNLKFDTDFSACINAVRQSLCTSSYIVLIDNFGKPHNHYSTVIAIDSIGELPSRMIALAERGDLKTACEKMRCHLECIDDLHALRATGAQLLSRILLEKNMLENDSPESQGIFDYIYMESNKTVLIRRMLDTAQALLQHGSDKNELIQEVKFYVKRNLRDSTLSLAKIASEHVFVNPDYLSRLFASETGERFSHYLNKLRVEKAKQLLQTDASKIYQVAEQVGLGHNPRYFGQVFKKYTDLTPSEYIATLEKKSV